MTRVACFALEPTDRVRRSFRRYATGACPKPCSFHNAELPMDVVPAVWKIDEDDGRRVLQNCYDAGEFPRHRFPSKCDACSYVFRDLDDWQIFTELLYRRADTGEETTLRDAPPGAMWNAWWMGPHWQGPDGRSLMVKLPNGREWCVDSRASNCTLPKDTEHRCWVRHGEWPQVTVDKNGRTCAAGAGSIQAGDYHGFLRNGFLESC